MPVWRYNVVKIRQLGPDRFEMKTFQAGQKLEDPPRSLSSLSAAQVVARLVRAPRQTQCVWLDEHGDPTTYFPTIVAGAQAQGMPLRSLRGPLGPCPGCGDTRRVNGQACRDCAPWVP